MPVTRSIRMVNTTVALSLGNLLEEPVEAIVNAANNDLVHGGGIAAAIARAAGPALEAESRALVNRLGPVPTGEAVVTTAGDLPYQGVIHTVGPWWGQGDEQAKLTSAVANALLRAHERGWTSLAMPGVSSGIFAVPHEICARAYLAGIRQHLTDTPDSTLTAIRITLFDGPLVAHVERAMDGGIPA